MLVDPVRMLSKRVLTTAGFQTKWSPWAGRGSANSLPVGPDSTTLTPNGVDVTLTAVQTLNGKGATPVPLVHCARTNAELRFEYAMDLAFWYVS